MADQFTRFLQGAGQGISNPKGNLGDFRHAARLYLDNQFSRAPRTKFLYHVQFNINTPALAISDFARKHGPAINMLVKQADLPKVTFEHDVKNEYNRKRIVYKDIKYEPLNLVFHDDNLGIINALWAQYLSYYSSERDGVAEAWRHSGNNLYDKTVTPLDGKESKVESYRYGLDVDKSKAGVQAFSGPFFSSITLFTLSRKKFNSYSLINPHILSWNHGNVDQSSNNGTIESTMNIAYETVFYGTGSIVRGNVPRGFGDLYYDAVPSPLTIGGGTLTSVFGPGGLFNFSSGIIDNAKSIYGDRNVQGEVGGGNLFTLANAVKAVNFYKSLRSLTPQNLIAEATNILLTPQGIQNVTSGIPGVSFGASNAPPATRFPTKEVLPLGFERFNNPTRLD